jgi:rubredoxin
MGKMICSVCGYVYDEAKGIPASGIAPGTKWEELPGDWKCPICGAPKSAFQPAGAPAEGKKPETGERIDTDMREFTALEMSALCSNLARGCEKQYKAEEASLFTQLAQYFKAGAAPAAEPDLEKLLALIDRDLNGNFPAAKDAAGAEPRDRGALRALTWSEKVTRIQKSLLERWQTEGSAMLENTGVWVCTICGFIYLGENPPALCPVCKVPSWKFEKVEGRAQ